MMHGHTQGLNNTKSLNIYNHQNQLQQRQQQQRQQLQQLRIMIT